MPWQWEVSRVCESFGCLPSQALAELGAPAEVPNGLIEDILLLRGYLEEWRLWKRARAGEKKIAFTDYSTVMKVEKWIGERKRLEAGRRDEHEQAAQGH